MASLEEALQSSQSFVRALKSKLDPPHENGPTKIEIARKGWDLHTFYIPRKAGLIIEWIFNRFHKERTAKRYKIPLLDPDHWSLLADVLTNPSDTHIEPLIVRASFPAVIASFITLYPATPINSRYLLLGPITRALEIMWPLALLRAGLDPLAECLWPSLAITDQLSNDPTSDGLVKIFECVITSFRAAFDKANTAGKKKAYTALTQHQLLPWLRALSFVQTTHPHLHDHFYSVGTDIIYNSDSLRLLLENNSNSKTSNIFSVLFGVSQIYDQMARGSLIKHLPDLYQAYISAVRKHRSSIFSDSITAQQTRERIRRTSLQFGDECLAFLGSVTEVEMREHIWEATVNILRVTEGEALFDSAEEESAVTLRQVGENALKQLDFGWDVSRSTLITHAFEALSCLQRIEPELNHRLLPRILERLATSSLVLSHSVLTFLGQLTSYYAKTRTLHTLVSHLLTALASSFAFLPLADPKKTYELCLNSPLLSLTYVDELNKILRTYMTPGQARELARSVRQALDSLLGACKTFREPARKRRRVSSEEQRMMTSTHERGSNISDVLKFSLVARMATVVLNAVLHNTAGEDAAETNMVLLAGMDALILDAIRSIFQVEDGGSTAIIKSKGKRFRSSDVDGPRWTRECLFSAILRLWYELFAEHVPSPTDMGDTWDAPGELDRLNNTLTAYMRQDVLPELQLEIGRILYACRASYRSEGSPSVVIGWPALDVILDHVEENVFTHQSMSPKSLSSSFPLTREGSALALWSLALERYLSTIDLHASQGQLERLVTMMVRARPFVEEGTSSSLMPILSRAFSSANFWEFGNLRASMLSVLDKQTGVFGAVDTTKLLFDIIKHDSKPLEASSKLSHASLVDLEAGVGIYCLLHYFPPEYLSRASRIDLATKALNADVLVQAFSLNKEPTLQGYVEWRAVFRSFAVTVMKQTQIKSIEDMASNDAWMAYLTLSKYGPAEPTQTYRHATLDLLSLIQISATRTSINSEDGLLPNVLNQLSHYDLYSAGRIHCEPLAQITLLRFANTLMHDFKASTFSESTLSLLRQLCTSLEDVLTLPIRATAVQRKAAHFIASEPIIEAWHVILSLKRWLSIEPSTETFGQMILKNTAQIMNFAAQETCVVSDKFRATVLSLLVAQAQVFPESDFKHVINIIAACILFTATTTQTESACYAPIARASRGFSVLQYENALDLVAETLQNGADNQSQLIALIQLSIVLLREAPERTSKLSYEHISRCLRIFINRPVFTDSSTMAAQILKFIQPQCTERAALLKLSDSSCIISILAKLLVGCSDHDMHTTPSIFQAIVHVLDALIRLRRDLVGSHLPQLSVVLRQLISVIRVARPLLGIKQYRMVSDTFPRWINLADPLQEAEAQSLARLLTSIRTKTLIRTHGSDNQKAESLARPFARHAPYVLLAYLQLMSDPLCVLPITMRRELEPGLFALCAIMGEHGRDTLMVQSLDISGKALLKSLWKEYNKQRYIGRG